MKLWEKSTDLIGHPMTETIRSHFEAWQVDLEIAIDRGHKKALCEQYGIGWSQFARGRLSDQFCFDVVLLLQQSGHKDPYNEALKRLSNLIKAIWDFSLKIWTTRNDAAAQTTKTKPSIQQQKWTAIAKFFYFYQHEFPDGNCRSIFAKPLHALLQASVTQLSKWCIQVQGAFHQSIARRI